MLNSILKASVVFSFFVVSQISFSQCSTCIPDTTCTPVVDGPTVCPEFMPTATSGVYYEEILTFYLPTNFDDPGTGQNVTLNQVIITSVTGLPYGMEFTLNNDDFTYYPSNGENFGCATICGTPILAGVYDVNISFHIFVEVFGLDIEVDQVFVNTIVVEQGESGNNSFIVDVTAGCGLVTSNFEALINTDDQPINWSWDFGNGNSSTEQFPPTQIFDDAGDYTVALTTQLWNYTLQEVNLIDLGGDWYGDVEEPIQSLSNPDPYFVVKDSLNNVVFSSDVVNNSFSHTWSGLEVVLNNPPYTIEFYDDDNISENDFLGAFPLAVETGYQSFDDGESNGLFVVELVNSDTFYDEEIVHVFPSPTFDFLVNEDDNTITINTDSTTTEYAWYINDEAQPNITPLINMNTGGVYSCVVSNSFGCQVFSEEYIHCPEFTPQYNANDDQIIAPEGLATYQWYYNGIIMEAETSNTIADPLPGNYSVEFTTDYGCSSQSEWFVFEDETSVNDIKLKQEVLIYPNPTSGKCNITINRGIFDRILIMSIKGTILENLFIENNQKVNLNLSAFPKGIYIIKITGNDKTITKKLIKK